MLLELERAFHWPFFIAEKGGDPLLWQHFFWFFGHPEVYIIFLPAAGMVSMIVADDGAHAARRLPLGRDGAASAIGVLSFGLWVHHMFTTGIPQLSLSFFSAASMAVSIPSGHPGLRLDRDLAARQRAGARRRRCSCSAFWRPSCSAG